MSAENVSGTDIAAVKKWVAKHPKGALEVSLFVKGEDGEELIQQWEAGEVVPATAAQIIEAVDAYAAASESDVVAPLKWTNKDGKLLQTRLLRRKYKAEPEQQHSMTGSLQDQAAQAQRFAEKALSLSFNAVAGAMQQMFRLSEATMQLCERISDGKAQADVEIQRLREEIQEVVVTQAEDAVADAEEQRKAAEEKSSDSSPIEQAAAIVLPMLPGMLRPAAAKEPQKEPQKVGAS